MTEKPQTPFLGWRQLGVAGFLVLALMAMVALSVGLLFGEDRGWIAGGLVGALGALIRISWPVRNEPWFRRTVAVFAALDALAIVSFDWSATHSWSGQALSGFVFLDLTVMMAIIYCLYCLTYGAPSEPVAEEEPSYSERDLDL